MATLSEIRSLGDTVSVFSSPIAEPLNAPMRFEDRLQRFGEHYNTGHDSHLYRFLLSLCGDAGAGTLKREKLYPRLQQILGSTYFQDLDKLYGNPLGISRLPKELYIYDPHHEALTQQQWTEVFAKDAAYRERCLTWMRAIIEGPTPKGIALAAEAACGFECDIFENYKYIDNAPLNRTGQILIGGTGSAGFLKRSLIINDQSRLDNIEGDGLPATQSSFGAWSDTENLVQGGKSISGWSTALLSGHTVAGAALTISETEYKFASSVSYASTVPNGGFKYYTGSSKHLVTSGINQGTNYLVSNFSATQTYTLSFWIKRVGSSGQIWAGLVGSSTNANITVTPSTTWTRYTVTWTPTTDTSMRVVFKQLDATATDVYIDGIQVEARPIATPFTVKTRTKADMRLSNPDTHLTHSVGWVAISFKPSWAATVDNFDNTGNDQPNIWSWLGATNTGYMRLFFANSTNQFTFARSNFINPSEKTVSVATAHAANDTTLLIASWSGSNISLSVNGGAYTSNSSATGLESMYGGNFFIGNHNLNDFMQGSVLALATGKTYQPNATTISNLLAIDDPDLTTFPAGTSSFWNAKDINYTFTGSDVVVSFANVPSVTKSRNEFTILPQVTDLEQKERRAINRLVDKLRPIDTLVTIASANSLRNELPILDVTASSTRFTVLRSVTGNSNITWPELNPTEGHWINTNTNEAPTFAFLDRQESATYLSIYNVESSSEHIGQFNEFQRSLFSHLENLNDLKTFPANNAYSKSVAPLNITTPWVNSGQNISEKLIINNHYPIGYFTNINTDIAIAQNTQEFWASTEKYAPAEDFIIVDLDVVRPVNFLDFNISQKPIDISVEYNDNGIWKPINIKEGFDATFNISYLPSVANPWAYLEYNFDIINTDKFKITFKRREEAFPDGNLTSDPWSIEVQNLRAIHLIRTIDDFVIDTGTDILGNVFQTDIFEYEVGNVIDPDEDENPSYWQSQPNPAREAVEALYFDLRDNVIEYDMAELNGIQMQVLDTRSMNDLTNYYSSPILVDEVYINPVTNGPDMHFYYSTDDTPDWDNKLWIPIPRHYQLRRGFFGLPSPTSVKYFKIEFSNLTPIPYQFIEYPHNITTTFRRYPTWVYNYFSDIYPTQPYEENYEMEDRIKIDPLKFGYKQYLDALNTGYSEIRSELFKDTSEEIKGYIEDVIGGKEQALDKFQIETQIKFFSPLMWQSDLLSILDPTRALSRQVQTIVDSRLETGWSAERLPPTFVPPVQKSVESLADIAKEKTQPILWFPRAVRHGYQLIEARFNNKVAYHVAIREVKFLRRDLSIKHDEEIYLETLEDESHITSNTLTRLDSYRWGVS